MAVLVKTTGLLSFRTFTVRRRGAASDPTTDLFGSLCFPPKWLLVITIPLTRSTLDPGLSSTELFALQEGTAQM
jgi:hypothetical protein